MKELKTDNQIFQWRQELLNLKEKVKQKQFTSDRALAIAQQLKKDYMARLTRPDFDIQNAHMQLCDNLGQANNVLTGYRADNVTLTTTTFNILISLSTDLDTATSYFNQLLDIGLKPNTYTLNGFISFCRTVRQGREIISSMYRYHVKPNTQTYNALLSLTMNDDDRNEIMRAMEDQNIEINLVTINTLISRMDDYNGAIKYYHDLKIRNIKPNINTFVTMLKKAHRQQDVKELEQLLKKENIQPNNTWLRLFNAKR
jgi:ribosomal protein L12E/L44/L45/RPP1/RPP2